MKQATEKQNNLPSWNLTDLYQSPQDPKIQSDIKSLEADCATFQKTYQGKLNSLSGDDLAKAIKTYEDIDERLSKLASFAHLQHAGQTDDSAISKFQQDMMEQVTNLSRFLLFFSLEINRIEDAPLNKALKDSPSLKTYESFLRTMRLFKPHQLSDDLEQLLHDKSPVGRQAWIRLYDETQASWRFDWDGEKISISDVLNKLADKNEKIRKQAAHTLSDKLVEEKRLLTMVTNVLAKDHAINLDWRNYDRVDASRHLSNQVDGEVVDALVVSVCKAYPKLSHRYYAIKAKWFGGDQLDYWNRNAPLPDSDDRLFSWDQATDLVLNAYSDFSPELAKIGKDFFDKNWIDADPRSGKDSGAFAHPCVPSVHPYILMNYYGKPRDVMTLAHELGHGVHQVLAGQTQGHLQSDTPLTLAETASVFGEMLTFQKLLSQTTDPEQKRALLAGKIEDMLNTVVRQISFYQFELAVHTERKKGELTTEQLNKIWLDVSRESLGPSLRFDEKYDQYWSYIPHFIHAPFYVYAYAFGDCLVNSLYQVYQNNADGFEEKYIDLLKAGGTKRYDELLIPFGLNAKDPSFWDQGLSLIESFIAELEML